LAWVPRGHRAIPGTKHRKYLEENIAAGAIAIKKGMVEIAEHCPKVRLQVSVIRINDTNPAESPVSKDLN
jgi:hypothetical protein